jgi:haloalkane dehalogenase
MIAGRTTALPERDARQCETPAGAHATAKPSPADEHNTHGPPPEPDPRVATLGDLYPFASHHVNVGGARMHYIDEGDGPPVIMLHGNPTWSFYFRELVRGLRDRHRVLVPDHIGCGFSDKPQSYPYTLATHIDNVERLIDHLNLSDVTLVVHDWGGAIGLGWAVRHPARVRRLVLFNTAAFVGGPIPLRIRASRWPVFGDVALLRFNAFARGAVRMACRHRERMTPDVKRGYLLPYDTPAHRVGTLCFVRDVPVTPKVPSYRLIRQIDSSLRQFRDRPMLICWGMKDFCLTDWYLTEWLARFPQAEVHRFEDAGHYVIEDAHERILPLLNAFLTRPAPEQA